jgi:biotin carboxyl carrier protein
MNPIVDNARALLRSFERAGYADIMVRQGDFSLFIARQNGGVNTLRPRTANSLAVAPADAPECQRALEEHAIEAPHLATFRSALAPGSRVEAGTIVATLELLDETIEVTADCAGIVRSVAPQAGELVEFGAPLLLLSRS